MSEPKPVGEVKTRLKMQVERYRKQSPKNALLLPYLSEIRELRARNAAYDDIRLILAEEKIIVSLNTLYRFCRAVLGEKFNKSPKQRPPKSSPGVQPASPPSITIQAGLQQQRKLIPGPWSRRKPGPRIADSKNL
jgi:hypothetical protein